MKNPIFKGDPNAVRRGIDNDGFKQESNMLLILTAIIVAGIVGFFLATTDCGLGVFFGIVIAIGAGLAGVSYAFVGWSWMASDHKANIINREYGTNYSREEIFWASDVIDTVRELDRKRVELNGDLMRDADER